MSPVRRLATMLLLAALCLGTWRDANAQGDAQDEYPPSSNIELYAQLGFPSGEFEDQLDAAGGGLGVLVGFEPFPIPLVFGIDLGFMWYDFSRHRFREDGERAVVESDNWILLMHQATRWKQRVGRSEFFAEALVGGKVFITDSEIKESNIPERDGTPLKVKRDIAFSYGGGVGVIIPFEALGLVLGMRYMAGDEATFFSGGFASKGRSRTDIFSLQVGVTLLVP